MSQKGISNKDISDYLNKQKIKSKRTERYTTKPLEDSSETHKEAKPKRSSRSRVREYLTLETNEKLKLRNKKNAKNWMGKDRPSTSF